MLRAVTTPASPAQEGLLAVSTSNGLTALCQPIARFSGTIQQVQAKLRTLVPALVSRNSPAYSESAISCTSFLASQPLRH